MRSGSWDDLEDFKFIDIEETYVLDWHVSSKEFRVSLDACLLEQHPLYELDERYDGICFKKATLCFRNPKNIEGLMNKSEVPELETLEGDITYWTLSNLEVADGNVSLSAAFGDVTFSTDGWTFLVHT